MNKVELFSRGTGQRAFAEVFVNGVEIFHGDGHDDSIELARELADRLAAALQVPVQARP